MVNPGWLTTREASKRAGVSDAYLRRLCGKGALNARNIGSAWLIDPASFRAWMEARQGDRSKQEQQK